MDQNERFVRAFRQRTPVTSLDVYSSFEVWVDRATGVNYLYVSKTEGAALTPLLGPDGKPVISPIG